MVAMRVLLLLAAATLPLAAQDAGRVRRPPATPNASSIALVSLGMDDYGRERLCMKLDRAFALAAASVDSELQVETDCSGGPRNILTLLSDSFASPQRSREAACALLQTPLPLLGETLDQVWIRRSEPPKPWDALARQMEGLGVRDWGGFLDAAGFARVILRRDREQAPAVDERLYELARTCG